MLTCEKALAHIEYERLMAEIRMLRLGLTYDVKSGKLEEKYAGQPRKKNGQFTFGKASGTGINLNLQFFAEKGLKYQNVNNLKKGIRSLEIKIAEHEEKILNPQKFVSRWNEASAEYKQGLIRHWKKEISNFKSSIDERRNELNQRGKSNER